MPETHLGTAAINKVSPAISVLCSLLQLSPGAKCLPSGSITTCSSTVPSSSCLGVPHEGLPCDIGGGGGGGCRECAHSTSVVFLVSQNRQLSG